MLKRFDHIVKNALKDLRTSHVPDWELFHDILRIEEQSLPADDSMDQMAGDTLRALEYTGSQPTWYAFESRIDKLNADLDAEFDQNVSTALNGLTHTAWTGAGDWDKMSARLDALNAEMDAEFDQAVGKALDTIPVTTWKEQHWQMLSVRLDRLNDRPRILLMKLVEVAAIILLLVQLTNLYTGIQQNRGPNNNLTTYLEDLFNSSQEPISRDENTNGDDIDQKALSKDERSLDVNGLSGDITTESNLDKTRDLGSGADLTNRPLDAHQKQNSRNDLNRRPEDLTALMTPPLPSDTPLEIPYDYLRQLNDRLRVESTPKGQEIKTAPQLSNDPQLIAYSYDPQDLKRSSPRLGVRDISLLSANTTDSILNSIPTLQVIRPRIYSSMEVGMLADATNVEIQDYLALSGPYHEPTLNPGAYFRYKIQYQNIFGSIGGDYLKMRYDGLANDNVVTLVSLPLELGYNFVNLPSFRMYFSGGIAGRFVPVANYSTEAFNQASTYVRKSQKPANGLLKDGPFEINSYLSGRMSMGLDINVNKKTSINLRFSHDVWLKGDGIGYNLDKFRSSHLAIGTNFHF